MSASLFSDVGSHYDIPTNYLDYSDGEKIFGELKKGDVIYYYHYTYDDIIEITVNGNIKSFKEKIILPVKSFGPDKNSKLEFGPAKGGWMGYGKEYNPDKIKNSSICISISHSSVFGTNKESVLKIVKSFINETIVENQEKILKLEETNKSLSNKLLKLDSSSENE